jgi:hypothetical protein
MDDATAALPKRWPMEQNAGMTLKLPVVVAASLLLCCSYARAETRRIEVDESILELEYAPESFDVGGPTLVEWVETSARAVASFYGRFPVERVRVRLRGVPGGGVTTGRTEGFGPVITVIVGRSVDPSELRADWVMTHEMVHLAFPSVPGRHHWLEEGLATYVEPLARLEIGEIPQEKVWADLVDGLPKGLPREGDRGLDFTPTWGRTYWGGALFCLLADLEIRKRTENRKGLRDALRAILASGGNMTESWPLAKALEIGDQAVGVPVLTELYTKMRAAPAPVDLEEIWKSLGVEVRGRRIFLVDAPLASTRNAIAPAPEPAPRGLKASAGDAG